MEKSKKSWNGAVLEIKKCCKHLKKLLVFRDEIVIPESQLA